MHSLGETHSTTHNSLFSIWRYILLNYALDDKKKNHKISVVSSVYSEKHNLKHQFMLYKEIQNIDKKGNVDATKYNTLLFVKNCNTMRELCKLFEIDIKGKTR